MSDFDIGDPVRIDGEFRNEVDVLTDPPAGNPQLKLKPPSADPVTLTFGTDLELVHDGVGLFHATVDPEALATAPVGAWGYRWIVATGPVQGSEPGQFFVRPEFHELWRPSVADVGTLLRARTRTSGGLRPGTFTDDTEPTGDQVEELISRAAADVFADLEADPVPTGRHQKARYLTALRAAMYVELSYYPEQVNTDSSIYDELKDLYSEDLTKLKDAIVDVAGTGVDGASPDAPLPIGTFPGRDIVDERVGLETWW